jgi:MFS family permease
MAIGPTLGALLTQHTQDLLAAFYVAAAFHILCIFLYLFVVPESLDKAHRMAAVELHHASQDPNSTWLTTIKHTVLTFAHPLVVFIPRRRPRGKGRDWSLTWIGIAFATAMLNMGSYSFKFQYALAAFGWGTTELGYWMSIVGVSRATHLVLIFPLLLKLLHIVYRGRRHTHVDLFVARLSLIIELLGYIVMGLIMDPKLFAITTCWMSLGGGFGPSVQSIALALCQDQTTKPADHSDSSSESEDSARAPPETGRLFGALSVLQALASQIVGPSLFGVVFVSTIASAPRAIFWTSGACVLGSLMALGMVRLKREERATDVVDEETSLL